MFCTTSVSLTWRRWRRHWNKKDMALRKGETFTLDGQKKKWGSCQGNCRTRKTNKNHIKTFSARVMSGQGPDNMTITENKSVKKKKEKDIPLRISQQAERRNIWLKIVKTSQKRAMLISNVYLQGSRRVSLFVLTSWHSCARYSLNVPSSSRADDSDYYSSADVVCRTSLDTTQRTLKAWHWWNLQSLGCKNLLSGQTWLSILKWPFLQSFNIYIYSVTL